MAAAAKRSMKSTSVKSMDRLAAKRGMGYSCVCRDSWVLHVVVRYHPRCCVVVDMLRDIHPTFTFVGWKTAKRLPRVGQSIQQSDRGRRVLAAAGQFLELVDGVDL